MHGSFGWIRDPESFLLYDKNEAIGRDDIHFYGDDAPDELIFGTDNKLRAQQPFLWMAHRFYDCVYSARYVVTIGYGFGDDYINQIIQQGMYPSSLLLLAQGLATHRWKTQRDSTRSILGARGSFRMARNERYTTRKP